MTMIETYITAVALLFCSGLPAIFPGQRSVVGERLSTTFLATGSLLGLVASTMAFLSPPPALSATWLVPGGSLLLRLDGLAAVFLLPAFLISGLGAIYALGYWPCQKHGRSAGRLRLFYGVLTGSIALLPACRNGILFLFAWEIMAIAGFLLILTEQNKEEVRRAAYVYLAATHTGTLALFALFTLLAQSCGSFDFPATAALNGTVPMASAVFLLALFGFGIKAGIMPLHIWLPGAHAAAPSHVSAVMSGVMIKMGIYGIIRICSFYTQIPAWWGWTILILGAFSGILGVAFAIAQHDLKRLLAYHSVENIGIILLGLGTALLGRHAGVQALTALGLAGALLHVINHGLFKSLLFLSAGSVINATGTRHIDHYGGLLRRMPATAFFFLGGAVAICGLPPLNGFVSEWLVYLGLLHSQAAGNVLPLALAGLAIPALAMIGALALACFVKVYGITFLGVERSARPDPPQEATHSMIWPMASLLFCCALIGLAPQTVVPLLQQALTDWQEPTANHVLLTSLAPVGWISLTAVLLMVIVIGFTLGWKKVGNEAANRPTTWGCGYIKGSPRMQYTASSFAEMLIGLFRWGLWSKAEEGRAIGFFPGMVAFLIQTPDVVLDRIIHPAFRSAGRAAFRIRSFLQHGVLGVYLLYSALTLCFFLILFLRFGD